MLIASNALRMLDCKIVISSTWNLLFYYTYDLHGAGTGWGGSCFPLHVISLHYMLFTINPRTIVWMY